MSQLPMFPIPFSPIFSDNLMPPSLIPAQQFIVSPLGNQLHLINPSIYYRPWRSAAAKSDTGSTITADKEKFQINLDVQQFTPEEITVKVGDVDTITVEGKHEEKQDEHGFISRHFVRRYVLPEGHDINQVVSNLSSDGVLSITAPRVKQESIEHRTVPIQQTGVPLKSVEKKELPKSGGDKKQ